MHEQDAGATVVNFHLVQQFLKHSSGVRFGIVDSDNLQTIDYDLLVVENGYSDPGQRRQVRGAIKNLFVITGHKISSGGRTEAGPRSNGTRDVDYGTIEHVARNEDRGRFEFS